MKSAVVGFTLFVTFVCAQVPQQGAFPQGSAAPQQGGFPPQNGTLPQGSALPPQQNGSLPQGSALPPQQGGFPPQNGTLPQGSALPPQQGDFPPQNGALPQGSDVPPQQGGFPQQNGTLPQGSAVPPQQGGFPQQNGTLPQGSAVPPQQGGFPSQISTSTLISKAQGSSYDYNYNAAIFTDEDDALGLLVRCQNLKNASVPFDVSQSYIVYSNLTKDNDGNLVATPPKTENSIPTNDQYGESCGTEDPRIAFYNGTYYLFYTAYDCKRAMLSVMTSQTPWDPTSWKREGFVIPGRNWSKSGAALFMTEDNGLSQHYLFWGDSSTPEGGIGICTSSDGKNWTDTGKYLMKIRNDINPFFDSNLVESGPSPIQLKTGDFLFIYNSAQAGYTSVKPNWQLQYNVGYVILDKTDPTQVVQRSNNPILSPVQDWEIGNDNSKSYLTPNVVFLEGLIRDPDGCPANVQDIIGQEFAGNAECFIGVYGGSDSDLGAVRIVASYVDQPGTSTISSTCACVSTNTCSSLSTCRTETTCTCSNEDKNPTSDTTPSVTTQSGTTQSGTTQSGTTQSGTTQSGTTPSGTTQGNAAGTTFPNVVTVVISAFLTLILF